jgi:carboxypeptidase C (cathepsin A)
MLHVDTNICMYVCIYMPDTIADWPGKQGFNDAKPKVWTSEISGKPAGKARTSGGFTFLQVFAAGHMVPLDQPEAALDMVKTFTLSNSGNMLEGVATAHQDGSKEGGAVEVAALE